MAADPSIQIVGEGGSGEELTALVTAHQPDVVLLDLGMPQSAGGAGRGEGNTFRAFSAIRWTAAEYPATRILVISQYMDRATLEGAAQAGVAGYILKDDELSCFLPEAVHAIHRGGIYFSMAVSQTLAAFRFKGGPDLTPRHKEILRAIVRQPNRSLAEHAASLGISESTLRNHLQAVYERLGVNNLTAAIVKAIQAGWLDVPQ